MRCCHSVGSAAYFTPEYPAAAAAAAALQAPHAALAATTHLLTLQSRRDATAAIAAAFRHAHARPLRACRWDTCRRRFAHGRAHADIVGRCRTYSRRFNKDCRLAP